MILSMYPVTGEKTRIGNEILAGRLMTETREEVRIYFMINQRSWMESKSYSEFLSKLMVFNVIHTD
jgi:hypothetical protein